MASAGGKYRDIRNNTPSAPGKYRYRRTNRTTHAGAEPGKRSTTRTRTTAKLRPPTARTTPDGTTNDRRTVPAKSTALVA